jgi:hypothetical protein
MTIYIVMEYDFGSGYIVSVHTTLESAQVKHAAKEAENTSGWVRYSIEEWETEA